MGVLKVKTKPIILFMSILTVTSLLMPLLMEQAQALPGNNIYSDSIGPQSDTSSPLYILPNPQESQPPTTDKLLWSYNTVDTICSSPVVADGVVYFTLQNGYVFAVNASTATPIWSFDAQDGIYSVSDS